jgi:hypothetical protein
MKEKLAKHIANAGFKVHNGKVRRSDLPRILKYLSKANSDDFANKLDKELSDILGFDVKKLDKDLDEMKKDQEEISCKLKDLEEGE